MRYIQRMMRNEPITFLVMLLMIALLLFGLWNAWPTPRVNTPPADSSAPAR